MKILKKNCTNNNFLLVSFLILLSIKFDNYIAPSNCMVILSGICEFPNMDLERLIFDPTLIIDDKVTFFIQPYYN